MCVNAVKYEGVAKNLPGVFIGSDERRRSVREVDRSMARRGRLALFVMRAPRHGVAGQSLVFVAESFHISVSVLRVKIEGAGPRAEALESRVAMPEDSRHDYLRHPPFQPRRPEKRE